MLDKATLQLSKDRWQEVNKIILEEERLNSPLQRWQKLNALYRMAVGLQILPEATSQEEEVVWSRWTKLRNKLLSHGDV